MLKGDKTNSYFVQKWRYGLTRLENNHHDIWKRTLYWYPSRNNRMVLVMPYRERKLYDISKDVVYDITEDMNAVEIFDEELFEYEFSETLKEILRERGISYSELARRVGVSDASVSRWTNRNGVPGTTMVVKIANALGVSVAELIDFPKTNVFDKKV